MESGSQDSSEQTRRFFSSPEEGVERISDFLRVEDFKTLASYYDLTGSGIGRAYLESGEFFIRQQRPELAHPAELWRYKHPFAPGFEYCGKSSGADEGVFVVRVCISIDQGADSPTQEGYSSFLMIQSDRGWQVLPQPVDENNPPEMPSLAS